MRAIAVDDEPLALEIIASHAEKVPFLKLEAVFTNALAALDFLRRHEVELVFLDIRMPDISGFELLESLPSKPCIVFTTAYAEHAVASYEADAVDYLLKPISFARFLKACMKAATQCKNIQPDEAGRLTPDYVFLKTGYEQVKVYFSDIVYAEGAGNYLTFYLADKSKILSRLTMHEALELLPEAAFARVHRSFIVGLRHVERYERGQVCMADFSIPISKLYAESFRLRLQDFRPA